MDPRRSGRRLAATSCLAAALLFGVACSGDDGGAGPNTTGAATSSASPDGSTDGASDTTIVADTLAPDDSIGPDDTGEEVEDSVDELDTAPAEIPVDTEPLPMANLPADGPATVGGVELPAGRVLVDGDQRLTWITEDVVPDGNVWLELFAAYPETGLYPVLLVNDDQPAGWEQEAFFANQPQTLDEYDINTVLEEAAASFDPARTSNGPAPASTGPQDLDATDARIAELTDARIALVETPRGVDAPSYMGWTGYSTYGPIEAIVTALRSWEERYGARVVSVGPSSMIVAIDRPPTDAEVDALSDELVLMDPDLETGGAPIEVTGLGGDLVGDHLWTLWWLS